MGDQRDEECEFPHHNTGPDGEAEGEKNWSRVVEKGTSRPPISAYGSYP